MLRLFALILFASMLGGCALLSPARIAVNAPPVQTYPWHQTTHHTAEGFRNIHGEPSNVRPLQAFRWMASRATRRVPPGDVRNRPDLAVGSGDQT